MFEKYRAKIYSRKLFQLSVCIFYFKKCGRINSKIYHVDHCGVYSSVALGTFTWLYRCHCHPSTELFSSCKAETL